MLAYLWVALGGALGGMARFGLGLLAVRLWRPAFPWGTLLINVVGTFVIGCFATLTGTGGTTRPARTCASSSWWASAAASPRSPRSACKPWNWQPRRRLGRGIRQHGGLARAVPAGGGGRVVGGKVKALRGALAFYCR